jgi:GNAT superfamily N-acetyltransferase
MTYSVTVEAADSEEVPAAVRRGIRNADPPDAGARDYEPVILALRDEGGAVVGGAYGATMWGWLMLDGLWVDAALRGRGLGGRLLDAAEAIARRRGCHAVWLDTFDFQARPFYERQGYRVVAELEGFPPGHTHYRLRKDLDPPA